jgi:hypothetical protein
MQARARSAVSVVLGLVAIGLLVRGWAYYWGAGPRDGEDIPSYIVLLEGCVLLFAAVLIGWRRDRPHRRVWIALLWGSGVLSALVSAWWSLNVLLERWAS